MRTDAMCVRGMRLDLHLSNRLVAATEWPRFTKGQKERPSKDGLIFVLDVWNVNDLLGSLIGQNVSSYDCAASNNCTWQQPGPGGRGGVTARDSVLLDRREGGRGGVR